MALSGWKWVQRAWASSKEQLRAREEISNQWKVRPTVFDWQVISSEVHCIKKVLKTSSSGLPLQKHSDKVNLLFFAAPVRKVDIQLVENTISCSSEGIYPQPELTWSTNPPSDVTPPGKPTVQETEQKLYKISSSLILSDTSKDVNYSCTVSTGRNKRRATLFKPSKCF